MTPTDFLNAVTFPARSGATLVVMLSFFVLLGLARLAGPLGIWLAAMVVPACMRYLVMLAAARARARDAHAPAIEAFSLTDSLWTLFPVLPLAVFAFAATAVEPASAVLAWALALVFILLFPAMIAVLVITHSPAESLNPRALAGLIVRTGPAYAYAVAALGLFLVPLWMAENLPAWLAGLAGLYLAFAFFCVTGAILYRTNLIDEVDIPASVEAGEAASDAAIERDRRRVLTHAYGFASRGNRQGALNHIREWLREDPDPEGGWAWFVDRMLGWENTDHALFFARIYLSRLLEQGEAVRAVKLMLRARLVNPRFRPLDDDLPAAVEAARATGNGELADALSQGADRQMLQ